MADLTVAPRFGGAIPATYRARLFPGFSDPDWETFVEHKMVCVGSPEDCYAEGFDQARTALAEGRTEDYLEALDLLAEFCPP